MRHVKTIHAIPIRINKDIEEILLVPQHKWKIAGRPMFAPMTKKLLPGDDSPERTLEALALEGFDGEAPTPFRQTVLSPVRLTLLSPSQNQVTAYEITPVLSHYYRGKHEDRAERLGGQWMTRAQALLHPDLSPTARTILGVVRCDPTGPIAPQAFAGNGTDRLVFARDFDRRAFWPLFVEMRPWLESHLWKSFDHPREVEDVLSDTGTSGYAHLDYFDGSSAKAWMGTIARNLENAVLRKIRQRCERSLDIGDDPLPVADDSPGPAETVLDRDEMVCIRANVERMKKTLKPRVRLAWRLRFEEQMQFNEIADTLSEKQATVVTWLRRAAKSCLPSDRLAK